MGYFDSHCDARSNAVTRSGILVLPHAMARSVMSRGVPRGVALKNEPGVEKTCSDGQVSDAGDDSCSVLLPTILEYTWYFFVSGRSSVKFAGPVFATHVNNVCDVAGGWARRDA